MQVGLGTDLDVDQSVGGCGVEIATVSGVVGGVSGRKNADPPQVEVADLPLLDDAEHGGADRRRRRRQLVEEQPRGGTRVQGRPAATSRARASQARGDGHAAPAGPTGPVGG